MREKNVVVQREAYSVTDLVKARIFGGRSRVYELVKSGVLASYKFGKLRRITAESVRRYQAELLEATRKDSGLTPTSPNLKNQKPTKPSPLGKRSAAEKPNTTQPAE
jgi:excisionase family DNA binding protein